MALPSTLCIVLMHLNVCYILQYSFATELCTPKRCNIFGELCCQQWWCGFISPSEKVTHHLRSQNLILWSSLHKSSSISELCRIWFNASTFWGPVWVWNTRFSATRFFSVAKLDGTILTLQDCVCVKIWFMFEFSWFQKDICIHSIQQTLKATSIGGNMVSVIWIL